jgi:exonuclease III
MRLATLNICHGGGGRRLTALLQCFAALDADTLVITEFRAGASGARLCAGLSEMAYVHQAASSGATGQNSVLVVSRCPLQIVQPAAGPTGHEHRLIVVESGTLRLIGAYFPMGMLKQPVFDHLRAELLPMLPALGLVLGDLNTGLPYEDEAGKTFACVAAFKALQTAGLVDAWRSRNPHLADYSWFSAKQKGFRVDHALCTPEFNTRVRAIEYVHAPRLRGATDHAALVLGADG